MTTSAPLSFPDYRQMRPLPSAFRHGRMVIRHYQFQFPVELLPAGNSRVIAVSADARSFIRAQAGSSRLRHQSVPHETPSSFARAVIHFQNVLSSSLALVGFDLNESELTHAKASFASGTKDHD